MMMLLWHGAVAPARQLASKAGTSPGRRPAALAFMQARMSLSEWSRAASSAACVRRPSAFSRAARSSRWRTRDRRADSRLESMRKGVRDLVTWFVGAPSHTTYHVPRRGNRGSLPISPTKDSRGVKKLGCIGCAPLGVEWLGTTHCCTLTS
jgi:hypothetical protein